MHMTHAGSGILQLICQYGFVLELIAKNVVLFDVRHPNRCAGLAAGIGSPVRAFGFGPYERSDLISVNVSIRELEVDAEGASASIPYTEKSTCGEFHQGENTTRNTTSCGDQAVVKFT